MSWRPASTMSVENWEDDTNSRCKTASKSFERDIDSCHQTAHRSVFLVSTPPLPAPWRQGVLSLVVFLPWEVNGIVSTLLAFAPIDSGHFLCLFISGTGLSLNL